MIATQGDYEAGRARSDNPEGAGDEGENTPGARFHPRSHENKELKDGAMLLRATTIFSEGQTNPTSGGSFLTKRSPRRKETGERAMPRRARKEQSDGIARNERPGEGLSNPTPLHRAHSSRLAGGKHVPRCQRGGEC